MRKDVIAALGAGFVLGALAHAAFMHAAHPAAPQAKSTSAPAAAATPPPPPAPEATAARSSSPSQESVPVATRMEQATPSAPAPSAAAGGKEAPVQPHAGTATAATPAAPTPATADEAIAEFRALAKQGMGAFGKHVQLAEKFRGLGPDGTALLTELLKDPSSQTRFFAAAVLEALAEPRSIPALDTAVNDPDVMVSRMASHALALMGTRDAIPALERALNEHAEWGVRVNSAYGLAKLGEASGRGFLLETYRGGGMPALVVVGPMADIGAPEFSAELRPMIGDARAEIGFRLAAIMCATKAKDRDALPALEAVIAAPDASDSLKDAARKAVNEIRGETVYPVE